MRAKKRKVVTHEETIKKLMEEFTGGVRTLESFLSSLSHCVVYCYFAKPEEKALEFRVLWL